MCIRRIRHMIRFRDSEIRKDMIVILKEYPECQKQTKNCTILKKKLNKILYNSNFLISA